MNKKQFSMSVGILTIENGFLVTTTYSHWSDNGVVKFNNTEHFYCETFDEAEAMFNVQSKAQFDSCRDKDKGADNE